MPELHQPLITAAVPHRSNRHDLKIDDEHTLTQDQVMAARGYEAKPEGGWRLIGLGASA